MKRGRFEEAAGELRAKASKATNAATVCKLSFFCACCTGAYKVSGVCGVSLDGKETDDTGALPYRAADFSATMEGKSTKG